MSKNDWTTDDNTALLTDLYELTMLQAYFREGLDEEAVFDLFVRRVPGRNYLLACGLDTALHYLETLHFSQEALGYLASLDQFSDAFVDYLADFRFTGDVHALPEGTPVFPEEPILEVVAPLGEAQLVETFLLNQITFQTGIASKAARVVHAAKGRTVADFGARRMHGADATLKGARAMYIAGVDATSNVLAGQTYDLPVTGTMAHSYVEAHDREEDAFRAFAKLYPGTTLLVDTYDTLEGVRNVIRLIQGEDIDVGALRLDSGDLAVLAHKTRRMLDDAGFEDVRIFASGGLDEHEIAALLDEGAPIDGFGVGTKMCVMEDLPALDTAYKLCAYAGAPRMKLSAEKSNLPGRKQVVRFFERKAARDVIATADESLEGGTPLLEKVMEGGERTEAGRSTLEDARTRAKEAIGRLPDRLHAFDKAAPPYEVALSEKLQQRLEDTRRALEEQIGAEG